MRAAGVRGGSRAAAGAAWVSALGVGLGLSLALLAFCPAAWLANRVASASGDYVRLADARGTVWRGSAVLVLTGGPGSRDASVLPGRLSWTLGFEGLALALRMQQACCIEGVATLLVKPALGRVQVQLRPAGAVSSTPAAATPDTPMAAVALASPMARVGQWPAAWLVGLGTPWNTLQPKGLMRLSTSGLSMEWVQGRWVFGGRAELDLDAVASRLSTLEVLGHYHLSVQGDPRGEAATLQLSTRSGALQMTGNGQWAASRLRFTGQASAAVGSEAALNNLLNLIGRRQGALSILSIG